MSSFEDTVLVDLALSVDPGIEIAFLDTGFHFPETLAMVDAVERRYGIEVVRLRPAAGAATVGAAPPDRCCLERKVEPFRRHLRNRRAWVTGVRRVESPTRAETRPLSWLASLLHFENEALIFANVHHAFRFVLLTITGRRSTVAAAEFDFFIRHAVEVRDASRRFTLAPDEITLFNPNTGTSPIFRDRRDAQLALNVYRRLPVLRQHGVVDGSPWGVSFSQGLFNMASDAARFRTRSELEDAGWKLDGNVFRGNGESMLPLYEAKMLHYFDHRWGTYEGQTQPQANQGILPRLTPAEQDDPYLTALPRYWVQEREVKVQLDGRPNRSWLVGFRDGCRSTDERTLISAPMPAAAVGHTLPLFFTDRTPWMLGAALSSLVVDYLARQKVGGTHMTFFIVEQLPIPPPVAFDEPCAWDKALPVARWVQARLLELSWTAWDMEPFARELGDIGSPFRWDPDRRARLRAELDAAFFHLYGLDRDDTGHVLSTFPVLNRSDGGRTQTLVLDSYDRIAEAIATGAPYHSSLDPPPGQGPRHPPR